MLSTEISISITFRKRLSFICESVFPVSILNIITNTDNSSIAGLKYYLYI